MDRTLRVLLVSSGSGSRGGGEIFLDYLARGLNSRGHEVIVWIPSHSRMDELAARCLDHGRVVRAEYANTYDLPLRSFATFFNRDIQKRISAEWVALAPDVIHINKQNLEDGLDLLRAASATQLPRLCTIHLTQNAAYLGARGAWLRDWISRRELLAFDAPLVAVLESRRRDLAAFVGASTRTLGVLNGVPLPSAPDGSSIRKTQRRALGISPDNILVMAVGRLVKQKRPFEFLECARALHEMLRQTRFVWVGDGDLAVQWRQAIETSGMESYVSCTGWRSDAANLMEAADVLLHVAEFEGLPLAIAEAAARGLPCALPRRLAEDLGVFDEANSLCTDDFAAFAAALANPQHLKSVGEKARRLASTSLTLDAMAASYEQIYLNECSRIVRQNERFELAQ